jgi:Predicted esterase of the alpha-beta hydrolase superfamily
MKPLIGLYSGRSLANYIRKQLPEGVENIEDTKIPFAATSVNLADTKTVWITKGSLAEAIRASSTVPFVYRPKEVDDTVLVDGGMRANLPTEVGQAAGAPLVIGVKLHSYLERVDKERFDTLWEYGDRLTSIIMAEIEAKTMKDADILIEPEVEYMNIYSFKPDKLAKAIAAGEAAARAALPKIREMLQTRTAQADVGNAQ